MTADARTDPAMLAQWRARWPLACRPMRAADVAAVDAVERRVYPFPWTPGNFADSLDAGYGAWVVYDDRDLCGYAVSMPVVDEWHLLNISVAPARQGEGLGALLLAWVEDRARQAGARSVLLEVRPSNVRALSFYERREYVRIGLRRGYYPAVQGREDAVVMRKTLPAGALAGGGPGR